MLHSHIVRRVLGVDKLFFCNQGVESQFSKRVNTDYSMAKYRYFLTRSFEARGEEAGFRRWKNTLAALRGAMTTFRHCC